MSSVIARGQKSKKIIKMSDYDADNNNNNDTSVPGRNTGDAMKRVDNENTRQLEMNLYESVISSEHERAKVATNGSKQDDETSADYWHLLDADGRSIAASSSGSSSSNEQELNICGEPTAQITKRIRKIKKRAVDVDKMSVSTGKRRRLIVEDQVGSDNSKLAPTLIFICTCLYALMPLASLVAFSILLWLIFTPYWPITAIYYTYIILDSKICNKGGRRVDAIYKSKFWTYLAAHFPITLRYSKNFKLNQDQNYILNYHPHGISAFGCVCAFATNGLNFTKLFPGIKSRFMVHETSFLVPIMRETFLFRGDCSVNTKSFDYILSKAWKNSDQTQNCAGNLLALCGGGLAEADLSDAECLKIVAANRKGFIKKALIHGANLIPCIAFGENSVFTKINLNPNSMLYKIENKFYSIFKFKHPLYYGSSLFGGDKLKGILPYKKKITVIMGDPIEVQRVEQPSQEQIDELHTKYLNSLKTIHMQNKDLCEKYDVMLELV